MTASHQSPLVPMVRKLELWTDLDDEDRQAVLSLPYTLRTIERAHYVVRDGDRVDRSCLLVSGYAYRQKIVADGARQIMSIHMAGELVDLQNSFLGVADHSVQALTDCELAFIPAEALRKLAFARPTVGMALWYDTLVDAAIFREWIANVGRRDARTRIGHLLCEFAVRLEAAGLGTHEEWELPMTQEQVADCTGLTPVHVNRTLKALDSDMLISRTKRSVTINDWKKLAKASDFDGHYLHLEQKPGNMLRLRS